MYFEYFVRLRISAYDEVGVVRKIGKSVAINYPHLVLLAFGN